MNRRKLLTFLGLAPAIITTQAVAALHRNIIPNTDKVELPKPKADRQFTATIVDNRDPFKMGRVKVRVQKFHDKFTDEELPWIHTRRSLNSAMNTYTIPDIDWSKSIT
jgi:hypothetical protein